MGQTYCYWSCVQDPGPGRMIRRGGNVLPTSVIHDNMTGAEGCVVHTTRRGHPISKGYNTFAALELLTRSSNGTARDRLAWILKNAHTPPLPCGRWDMTPSHDQWDVSSKGPSSLYPRGTPSDVPAPFTPCETAGLPVTHLGRASWANAGTGRLRKPSNTEPNVCTWR